MQSIIPCQRPGIDSTQLAMEALDLSWMKTIFKVRGLLRRITDFIKLNPFGLSVFIPFACSSLITDVQLKLGHSVSRYQGLADFIVFLIITPWVTVIKHNRNLTILCYHIYNKGGETEGIF